MTDLFRVIDLETTGFTPPAEVIEIGWCDMVASEAAEPEILQRCQMLVKPTGPVPPETSAIHHLIAEDLKHGCSFAEAASAARHIAGDYNSTRLIAVAHSAKFERQWLEQPFGATEWICTYKCAMRLWPDAPGHSNQTLRYWLNQPGLDREFANRVHRALPDAYVTAFTLHRMLQIAQAEDLIKWSNQPAMLPRCPIGKYRGQKWADIDAGFLIWMLDKDFDEDVLFSARSELQRRDEAATAESEETSDDD